LAHR
jgi:hypothetical protein